LSTLGPLVLLVAAILSAVSCRSAGLNDYVDRDADRGGRAVGEAARDPGLGRRGGPVGTRGSPFAALALSRNVALRSVSGPGLPAISLAVASAYSYGPPG